MKYLRRKSLIILYAASILITTCFGLWSYNQAFKILEDEAPFDHARSVLLKPFYGMTCPIKTQTNCNKTVPIHLIHGRPSDNQFRNVLKSWRDSNHEISIIDSHNMSRSYHNTKCQHFQWHQRLFHVYQLVFQHVLSYDDQQNEFAFIEDDVLLLNTTHLNDELCVAQQYEFYSFYHHENGATSCLYHHGTQAFYIRRSLMEKVIHDVSVDAFCRLPIDMYIATLGPWYKTATKETIVEHIGSRFHVEQNDIVL